MTLFFLAKILIQTGIPFAEVDTGMLSSIDDIGVGRMRIAVDRLTKNSVCTCKSKKKDVKCVAKVFKGGVITETKRKGILIDANIELRCERKKL